MVKLIWWAISGVGVLFAGFVISGVIYNLWDRFYKSRLLKKAPTEPKDLLDPGKDSIMKKEEKEDERVRTEQNREYEKLRRLAIGKSRPETTASDPELERLRRVSDELTASDRKDKLGN